MSFIKLFENYHDEFDESLEAAHMLGEFDMSHHSDYDIAKLLHGVELLDKDITEQFIVYVNGELHPETIAPCDIDYSTRDNKEGWTEQTSDKFPKAIPMDDHNNIMSVGLYNLGDEHMCYVLFEATRNVYASEKGKMYMTLERARTLAKDMDKKWEYFKHMMPEFYNEWSSEWS